MRVFSSTNKITAVVKEKGGEGVNEGSEASLWLTGKGSKSTTW